MDKKMAYGKRKTESYAESYKEFFQALAASA